jgi:hypothetical protein
MDTRYLPSGFVRIHHIRDGAQVMPELDAHHAIGNFPSEWSSEPWPSRASRPGDVEIPDNWPYVSVDKRRAIAMELGADRTVSAGQAEAVIEKELKRRK